ncbi:MAG: phage tail protein [Alphaproteobacteria bacterium]|nr:phage tail protein [Alphaproteobacteria bacterium]
MIAATNRPTLDAARQLPVNELVTLPADHLALLQEEAREAVDAAKRQQDWIEGIIAVRYGQRSIALRAEQRKDTGTVRFADGDVTVVADLSKRVEWDQDKLAAVVERIRAAGNDPTEYVEITYKVPERAYAAWPAHIRDAFTGARTVRTGKATFKLSLDATQGGV